jgi:hypothetical protein
MAQKLGRGIALLFHDHGTKRGEWSAARPGRILRPGKTRYPLYTRLGGPQGRSGRAENLAPPGFDRRTVQSLVSRYTDWATRPTQNSVPLQILGADKFCVVIAITQQLTLPATLHFPNNTCGPLVATTIKYTHPTVFTTKRIGYVKQYNYSYKYENSKWFKANVFLRYSSRTPLTWHKMWLSVPV